MKFFRLIIFFSFTSVFSSTNLNSLILQDSYGDPFINDSIIKYKSSDPNRALEFGFNSLKYYSSEKEITLDFVLVNYYIGETFYYIGNYRDSYQYLKKSLELYELLDSSDRRNRKVSKPPWILVIMGNVYFRNQDFDTAKIFYDEALINFKLFDSKYEEEKLYGINTSEMNLALIEVEKANFEEAKIIHEKVLKRRIENGDKTHIALSYFYILDLNLRAGKIEDAKLNYQKIEELYNLNIENESANEFKLRFGNANYEYGKYLENQGEQTEALGYFNNAKKLLVDFPTEIPKVNYGIAKLLIQVDQINSAEKIILESLSNKEITDDEKISNFKLLEELYVLEKSNKKLLAVKDSIIVYSEKPFQKLIQEEFNVLENLILVTDKQQEINKSKSQALTVTLMSIIILFSLLMILMYLKYNYELQKEKNIRLNIEKSRISDELKITERELFSKINFIVQRNDHINKLKKKITKNRFVPLKINSIKKEMDELSRSNKAYQEFDRMFSQVYPEFYKKLNKRANLSKTDIRLASYIKMNHSNNEIARISGISMRTVESQRYRLSKKLNITKAKDLNSFILSI